MDELKEWGIRYMSNRPVQKGDAVMFDIDDTLIFTDDTPNQPIIDLVHIAKRLGYEVVIITARPDREEVIQWTIEQLHGHTIDFDTIGFTSAETKTQMKQHMKNKFILSVGDLPTDLTDSEHWLNISNYSHN
jgi:predicted HAD superfamily phosphohydrolase YqeG